MKSLLRVFLPGNLAFGYRNRIFKLHQGGSFFCLYHKSFLRSFAPLPSHGMTLIWAPRFLSSSRLLQPQFSVVLRIFNREAILTKFYDRAISPPPQTPLSLYFVDTTQAGIFFYLKSDGSNKEASIVMNA